MKFVYLHGGPGFNSFSEQVILGPLFHAAGQKIVFWNEPSKLRPAGERFETAGAFERWVASAERCVVSAARSEPVCLITHSLSVHAGIDIAHRHPGSLATLVIVGPSADTFAALTNVLRLAHEDLVEPRPEIASAIAQSLERTRAVLDEPMREGLLNVLHDDRLFAHYWADPRQMQASMAARARPDGQFDADSFFAVLGGMGERGSRLPTATALTLPTLVLFGCRDRITSFDEQRRAIVAAVPDARVDVLDGCSHYVHLDRPQHFVDLVVDWAAANWPRPERVSNA